MDPVDSVTFASELLSAGAPALDAQQRHPFLRGLADGTLPEAAFRCWLEQDYHYLLDYARVLGFAVARADGRTALRELARALALTVELEMPAHRQLAASLGITEEELAVTLPKATTRAYADFMLRTAATGSLLTTCAALFACAASYAALARGLTAAAARPARPAPPAPPAYREWIRLYSSPEMQTAADALAAEVDRLAAVAGPGAREAARQAFVTALDYEARFWEMCWTASGGSVSAGSDRRGESPAPQG